MAYYLKEQGNITQQNKDPELWSQADISLSESPRVLELGRRVFKCELLF